MTITGWGWRLSSTEAGLQGGALRARQIPTPDTIEYNDHSVRTPQSEGGEARHGHQSVVLLWTGLDRAQAQALREVVQEGLDSAGYLYVTFDRSYGLNAGIDFVDARGRPAMPEFKPRAPIWGEGLLYGNVRLFVNALAMVNDPAVYS